MITRKAEFGSMNHDQHRLKGTPINQWFLDPEGFKAALVEDGLFVQGDPENSPFFLLTSFETGRMYRVFTDDELRLWADWCRSLAAPEEFPAAVVPAEEPYSNMVRLVDWIREGRGRDVLEAGLGARDGARRQVPTDVHEVDERADPGSASGDRLAVHRTDRPARPTAERFRHRGARRSAGAGAHDDAARTEPLHRPAVDVVLDWVAAGAPVPPAPAGPVPNLWLE